MIARIPLIAAGVLAAWTAIALPVGIFLGRIIHRADVEQRATRERLLRLDEKETAK